MEKIKSNYNAIANDAVKARKEGLSYGQLLAKDYTKLSDLLFWQRYNEFKKKQNKGLL